VLLAACLALVAIGAHANAWPWLFKRSPNPNYRGPGASARVGRVMVHIERCRSGATAFPRTATFPWASTAQWTWSPPECAMLVVYPGDRVVKRDWVVSWPSHYPKGAILGVFRTGPGRATIVGVHGAWVWSAGLLGAGALLAGPTRRAVRRRRSGRRPWSCPACGYDRRGIASGAPCPECGELPIGADVSR